MEMDAGRGSLGRGGAADLLPGASKGLTPVRAVIKKGVVEETYHRLVDADEGHLRIS